MEVDITMKKFVLVTSVLLVLLATLVSATENPFNKGWQRQINRTVDNKCLVGVQPWGYEIWGSWGALSNGSKICGVWGSTRHNKQSSETSTNVIVPPPVPEPPKPDPVCEKKKVCHFEEKCGWVNEPKKDDKCHKPHKEWKCTKVKVCEEKTVCK
jgi:hypothetical protein